MQHMMAAAVLVDHITGVCHVKSVHVVAAFAGINTYAVLGGFVTAGNTHQQQCGSIHWGSLMTT